MLESLSHWLEGLGLIFVYISPVTFLIYRWLVYIWKYEKNVPLVKAIWYFAMGILYVLNDLNVYALVTALCFIESFDLFFHYLELKKNKI